jgi:ADP-heptose:LPS heptosyltransferase
MLDCLRADFPQAKIIGVLRKNTQGIVKDGPWFDSLVDCQDKSWGGLRRMISQIRRWKPDVGIVLPNSVRSALTMRLSGVPKVYGYRRDFRGMLLTGGPRAIREGHKTLPVPMTEYYLEICRWLGLRVPQRPKPHLFIELVQLVHDRLKDEQVLKLLEPFVKAGEFLQTKSVTVLERLFPEVRELVLDIVKRVDPALHDRFKRFI